MDYRRVHQRRFSAKVRLKISRGNSWHPPLTRKSSRYAIFSEKLKGFPEIFLVPWDKTFSTETRELCSLLSSLKNFDTRNYWYPKRFSNKVFRHRWINLFLTDKLYTLSSLPRLTLLSKNFFDSRNLLKHRTVPRRSFPVLWDKKISDTESLYHPLMHKLFRYPKFSEKQKCSSSICFGTVRQNNFDRKSWYPYPSYEWKFSILQFFIFL